MHHMKGSLYAAFFIGAGARCLSLQPHCFRHSAALTPSRYFIAAIARLMNASTDGQIWLPGAMMSK